MKSVLPLFISCMAHPGGNPSDVSSKSVGVGGGLDIDDVTADGRGKSPNRFVISTVATPFSLSTTFSMSMSIL
jgi:hypothetical protein